MQPQLYMWSGTRARYLQRHDFYVDQVRKRVLSQFSNIEEEAERYSQEEYERLSSLPGREDVDMADLAQSATDNGQEFYGLLHDLRTQMILGSVAGMYHQWDKDLREFLELQLRHNYTADDVLKIAWNENVFEILKQFGWDCSSSTFFKDIDACRLIVNVYKHGKGSSLKQLAKSHPEYLKNPLADFGGIWATSETHLEHDWLILSEAQFEKLAAGFRRFWKDFPERLFLPK
ncbi:MAG TPA: hypothetical protein VJL90_12925 [Pseudorhodoplanes sp.]|nr:hypothetical protein [Pseudorhodoplanes sp.]